MSLFAMLLLAAGPVYAEPEVPDPELAVERGGFRLPNGIDVAMTVQSQTALNGQVVLQTVFAVDQGPATLIAYAPRTGEAVAAPSGNNAGSSASPPQVIYDSRSGIQVIPGLARSTVAVGNSAGTDATLPAGLEVVDAASGVTTANGVITRTAVDGRQTVRLDGPDLSVTHLAGNAFGSVIANTGSDRTIDTTTTLSIDLRNAGPDVLGSAMLRVEGLALGAIMDRTR